MAAGIPGSGAARAAQGFAEALTPIAVEHGFEFLLADNRVLGGSILSALGSEAEGLRQVPSAIAAYQATGARFSRPAHLTLLAKVCVRSGWIEDGVAALADALAVMERTGERTYEAELYRVQGELALSAPPRNGRAHPPAAAAAVRAEACFERAIAVARRQQAKALELRATTSLGRLWQRQGKRQRARERLAAVAGWFSEGLDTADLQDAHALLAALV